MRSTLANLRLRSNSHPTPPLQTVPPPPTSEDYSVTLAATAARILYRSPLPSRTSDLPVYVFDSAAIPAVAPEKQPGEYIDDDEHEPAREPATEGRNGSLQTPPTQRPRSRSGAGSEANYFNDLLPYVLARLPPEEELLGGLNYEIVFFAGGSPRSKIGHQTKSTKTRGTPKRNNADVVLDNDGKVGTSSADNASCDSLAAPHRHGRNRSNSHGLTASVQSAEGPLPGKLSDVAPNGHPSDHAQQCPARETTRKADTADAVRSASSSPEKPPNVRKRKASAPTKPGFGWLLRVYNVLSRALRKRLQKLWIVHEKGWVRLSMGMFAAVVSPKFSRKKVVHISSMTALALHFHLEELLVPPTAYAVDRQKVPDIHVPYATGRRAFNVRRALPTTSSGDFRLPRVLRETTAFILTGSLVCTEGLFRVSAKQQTVDLLREAYDRGQKYIIWREGQTAVCSPHYREGHGNVAIDTSDLENLDGYDVHVAAGLIKLWYKKLREPIFPKSSYHTLEQSFGYDSGNDTVQTSALVQLLSPGVGPSPLNETARYTLTRHLLPLLSDVAEHAESNKMTPGNLAVCISPALICGPDPLEDLKMSGIVHKLLTALIIRWKSDVAPALNLDSASFQDALTFPSDPAAQDEPLEESRAPPQQREMLENGQISGKTPTITLQDNEISEGHDDADFESAATDSEFESSSVESDLGDRILANDSDDNGEGEVANTSPFPKEVHPPSSKTSTSPERPPLPQRPSRQRAFTSPHNGNGVGAAFASPTTINRKPVAATTLPPRYSTVISPYERDAAILRSRGISADRAAGSRDQLQPARAAVNPVIDHLQHESDDRRVSIDTILPAYEAHASTSRVNGESSSRDPKSPLNGYPPRSTSAGQAVLTMTSPSPAHSRTPSGHPPRSTSLAPRDVSGPNSPSSSSSGHPPRSTSLAADKAMASSSHGTSTAPVNSLNAHPTQPPAPPTPANASNATDPAAIPRRKPVGHDAGRDGDDNLEKRE